MGSLGKGFLDHMWAWIGRCDSQQPGWLKKQTALNLHPNFRWLPTLPTILLFPAAKKENKQKK